MSEAKRESGPQAALDETAIAEYLQRHPDFLHRYPEVLETLEVHHESGGATSLIERQVGRLRDQNRKLQARLDELIEAARNNETRVAQINSLAQALIVASDSAELACALRHCVQREMGVEAMFIGLRGLEETIGDGDSAIHCLREGEARDSAVTHVFRRGKPLCGELTPAQKKALFGNDAPALASAAMVPLGRHGVQGALVLASSDARHFAPDMGTLFLELMGELVTTALRRHLTALD